MTRNGSVSTLKSKQIYCHIWCTDSSSAAVHRICAWHVSARMCRIMSSSISKGENTCISASALTINRKLELYSKVFSTLPTPNQPKTCIKHTFLTKKIIKKKISTDLPIPLAIFLGLLQEANNFSF